MSDENLTDDAEQAAGGKRASANLVVARAIARAIWLPEFKAANPEAGPAEIKAAWHELRQAKAKSVRQAIKSLEKRGFVFTAPTAEVGEDGEDGEDA